MATFASDYAFGTANEIPAMAKLEKFLETKLIRRGGKHVIDYDNNDKIFAEIKTRRIHSKEHRTTLVGANKVDEAKNNPGKTYWFFYDYTDGLYGIKYNEEKFRKYERGEFTRGAREDYHNRPQEVVFIPIRDLMPIFCQPLV
jgi:hypothetical protein